MNVEYRQNFIIDDLPFSFICTKDNQFIIENLSIMSDEFCSDYPTDYYRSINPITGFKVYKKVFQIALNLIFNNHLHYFWFSIGNEPKRLNLYTKIAEHLQSMYGFYCYYDNGIFKFYN